jgi:hypothetical protein
VWVSWGLLGIVLFRFWPPAVAEDDLARVAEIEAVPGAE